jgi:hypothetical protein
MSREEEDQKARERAVAYKTMMGLWSFQDFLETIKSVREEAVKSLYQMPDEKATEAKFGEIRGTLKAIDKIERDLDYILSCKEIV